MMDVDPVLAFLAGMLVGIGICWGMFVCISKDWYQ